MPLIRSVVLVRRVLALGMLCLAAAAGCRAQGPYITHAAIEWPGATQQQLDDVVAKPVGWRLFGATNSVVEVTAISTAGRVDLYATSDGLTKQPVFVHAIGESLADSAGTLPRDAVAGPIELLSKGEPIPHRPAGTENKVSIDIDRAKLIDAGLSYDDVSTAVARAREEEASRLPANAATTAPSAESKIQYLKATTLPSRDKPLTLGDVAYIHIVAEPVVIERHWP